MDPLTRIRRAVDLVTRGDLRITRREDAMAAAATAIGRTPRAVKAWCTQDPDRWPQRTAQPTADEAERVEQAMRELAAEIQRRAEAAEASI